MAPTRHERAGPAGAPPAGATPSLLRWGAVIGGGIIGLSLLALLTALWLALAFGTGVEGVEANLDWLLALSAVLALFIGGLMAGWLSGVPGFAPGLFNGLTVWGVILTVTLLAGTPGALQTMDITAGANLGGAGQALWAGFVAMLIGALAAALGGGAGGMMTRPAFTFAAPPPARERDDRRDADERPAEEARDHRYRDDDARAADRRADERPAESARVEDRPATGRRTAREPDAPANGGSARGRR